MWHGFKQTWLSHFNLTLVLVDGDFIETVAPYIRETWDEAAWSHSTRAVIESISGVQQECTNGVISMTWGEG